MDGLPHRFQLAAGVHVAVVGDGTAIFLDVRGDRYLGVEAGRIGCLGKLIAGWPSQDAQSQDDGHIGGVGLETASELVEDRLITEATPDYIQTVRRELRPAERTLLAPYADATTNISAAHAWRFLRAWLATEVTLKRGSLRFAIRRIQLISTRGANRPTMADYCRLAELVGSFRRLRSAFYTARLECLYNSAALYRYLIAYGVQPTFVMGVAVRPFRAHCWLQSDDLVYDDEPEFIQQFVPILTV
jgi:hypothetical protein